MKDAINSLIEQALDRLVAQGRLPADLAPRVLVERTRDPSHGDLASNVALSLAKGVGMPPRQLAHVASPVSRIGPVTTRGGRTFGLRARSCACTASKTAASMIAGTVTATCSDSGLSAFVFQTLRLKRYSPL